ncbi:hypothetical protein M407DRAFT_16776 [Tulasnella calospora MUT 4182]|uniref:PARP catalytic domain-containing protein n=1 Tax=Tulasnella calospora MUT 4182 TaxID=1051891 RepID=A0A0C3QZG9_9AGAM|nr:hypothetical protein M407DRAFT_16776 [Tulasnella calospora MUT 4182]
MASNSLPFRVYLGSHNDNHSLVVYSSKGINWQSRHNVHPDLEELLQTITSKDIIDLSLGCDGRYWIKFSRGTAVQRRLTQEAWNEVHPQLQRRLKNVSKVSLGVGKEIWVFSGDNKPPRHFLKIRPPVANILLPQGVGYPAAKDIEFVELGHSPDNFVIKVGGKVVLGRHKGIQSLTGKDKTQNERIAAAALSPLDDSCYFIMFDDGSHASSLPKALEEMVTPHLPDSEPPSPREDEENFIPFPLWLLSRVSGGSSFRIPPVGGSSTQLRLLHQHDSERKRVEDLFLDSWVCQEKPCPPIHHIYEIEMPGSLVVTYCAYRLNILCTNGDTDGAEQLLFHGTLRLCSVGNGGQSSSPCKNRACRLCCILRNSFKADQAGTVTGRSVPRFGKGIYTSRFSSKADKYNGESLSQDKAMLVARVVLGRSCTLTSRKEPKPLLEAPAGYNSVLGKVGASEEYDVHAVYKDEAILPAYLIIYQHS